MHAAARPRRSKATTPLSSQRDTPAEREPAPLMAAQGGLPLQLLPDAVAAPAAAESAIERPRRWDRAVRVQYERQRRRRVAALYAELRSMLPALSTTTQRVSMEEIVVAAAAQVKALEAAAATLESYRASAPGSGGRDVAVSTGTVTFSVRLPAAPAGAMRRVLEAFERRGARVLVATMARRGDGGAVVTVTANAVAPEVVGMIRADIARII